MTRSHSCTLVLATFLLGSLSTGAAQETSAQEPSTRPPNIVLILSDDQSWTDYGFMGHQDIKTPNLDRLAKQSVLFRRGYVPTALCRPALATLATGLYAHQNRVTGNDPARTPENRAHAEAAGADARELLIRNIDKNPTVPRLLAQQGYLSFQCGKWWEGSYQRGGFTHGMTRGFPTRGGRHGDDGLRIGREGMQPVNEFIDSATAAGKPFFLWYAPFMPHTPHNPPQRLLAKYASEDLPLEVAKYYAMCEWFDETCGQLLDRLDAQGIADNTLVIYVTDNGWIQSPSGGYAPRSKRSPYEAGTRTPIMFRWPGVLKPADRSELCSSIDIAPTILAAAGAKVPAQMPGLNLLPQLESGGEIDREAIFGESFAHDIADIANPHASLLYRWVIRDDYKLLLRYAGQPGKMKYPPTEVGPQLFNLKRDPHEQENLAESKPELVAQLSHLLTDWYPAQPYDRLRSQLDSQNKARQSAPDQTPASGVDDPRQSSATPTEPIPPASNAATIERPNILLLFADDQRDHTLGCAGHPVVQTPNIDRLAAGGVRFENAFVSTSTCWVSRACLFTGCYERKHLYRVKPGPLDPALCETSYFATLKRAGYRTGHLGKEHVSLDEASAAAMFDVRRKLGRNPYFKPQADGTERHETQILGDWGSEFLEQQSAEQPFCLTISFNASHAEDRDKRPGIGHYPWPKVTDGMYEDEPILPPTLNAPEIFESQPEFLQRSLNRQRFFWRWDTPEKYQANMRAYFRMISGIDHVVGRLHEKLRQLGLADNTIVIYTADNGYYLGDRGFAGKWTHYDQSLRVPLIIFDPRHNRASKRANMTRDEIVLGSDLASTIIQFAGLPLPASHTGRSLVPLVEGKAVADWRTDFLCEFLAVPQTIPVWEGVRAVDWSYARYFVDGPTQPPVEFLYDLNADPQQLRNLADLAPNSSEQSKRADRNAALQAMRTRCDALVAAAGPTMSEAFAGKVDSRRPKRRARQ